MRKVVVGGAVLLVLLATTVVIAFMLFVGHKTAAPGAAPPSPTASKTAEATPSLDPYQTQQAENPILVKLPHQELQWQLTQSDGPKRSDKYELVATVYYAPGTEDPKAKIAQQKPYIEKFVKDSGQTEGTYVITYQLQTID